MSKTSFVAIVLSAIAILMLHSTRKDLVATQSELRSCNDREYGIEAENDRLVEKMRGCEMTRDELEDLQSEKTFLQLDYDQCKRDRDAAIQYGIKCLKQKIFSRGHK